VWCGGAAGPPQIEKLSRRSTHARLDATLAGLVKYMPDATATRPDGGFFISLTLPGRRQRRRRVRQQASTRALTVADGSRGSSRTVGGEPLRSLPFCALSPTEIDEGLKRSPSP
jgi:DNA-binding transcriptional MocR family regulator